MQGILDAVTTAGALPLAGCAHALGGFCDMIWAVVAYRFPVGVLLLVGAVSGGLLLAELSRHHPNHRRAPEPPRRA